MAAEQKILDALGDATQSDSQRAEQINAVVADVQALADRIGRLAPDGRRKALALTNLEQSAMWFMASVLRG